MLRKILPHAAIIISVMYFVFFFIDRVNTAMAFINNDMTKFLLFGLCVITIANAVFLIADDRKRTRAAQQRRRPVHNPEPRRPVQQAQPRPRAGSDAPAASRYRDYERRDYEGRSYERRDYDRRDADYRRYR